MKIISFVGSPRKKGNSDIMADTFLKGASAAGAETKKFFLDDYTIHQCQGCFRNCMTKLGYRCAVHRDDMDMLLEEMVSADVMLFVSPLYCSVYSAIMARFFERCLPLWEVEIVGEMGTMDALNFINLPVKGKKAVIGIAQDFKNTAVADTAFAAFESNISMTYQMEIVGKIHATDVRDVGDISRKEELLEEIYTLGEKLARNTEV